MARVEIASQAWGTLFTKDVNPAITTVQVMPSAVATLKNLDGSNATTWSALAGGTSSTASLTTDSSGILPRYVNEGTYTLTVGSVTRRVEATPATTSVIHVSSIAEVADAITLAGVTPGLTIEFAQNTTFTFTSSLAIPQGTSIRGGGRSTELIFQGCDGLVFSVSNYIGPQIVENVYLHGNGYTFTAVKALGDADAGRVQGITVRDVLISTFKTAFQFRSTHGWHLNHVTVMDVWEGVKVAGQTILLTIDGGSEFSRDNATGTGSSKGFSVAASSDYNPGGTTTRGPEGMRLSDTTFFGFAFAVDHDHALDASYDRLTLGLVSNTAFQANLTPGGLRLRDSWIGFDNGALYGVRLLAAGSEALDIDNTIIVQGNHSDVESGMTTDANSVACAVDSNRTNVTIRDNTWNGCRLHDIRLNFAGKVTVADNNCRSSTSGASIQLVSFGAGALGPYYVDRNKVATNIFEHGSNTDHMVTAAATITIPKYKRVLVNGTTTITSITAGDPEQEIILHFTSTAQITDGGNLFLAGNFTGSANRTLSLFCDGANWLETARSTN